MSVNANIDKVTSITPLAQDCFQFGRQSIIDNHYAVYGFELLYRPIGEIDRNITGEMATARTIGTSFSGPNLKQLRDGDKPLFINMTKEHLMNIHLINLPTDLVVYEILEDTIIDSRLIDRISMLRGSGYRFALDDFKLTKHNKPLIPLVSYVKLDILAMNKDELVEHIHFLKKFGPTKLKLIAEKIETNEHFNWCKKMGFDLYQGYLFEKPQLISGVALNPSRSGIQRALQRTNDPQASFIDIADLIAEDPGLTFKLLRFCGHTQNLKMSHQLHEILEDLGIVKLRVILSLFALGNHRTETNQHIKDSLLKAQQCKQIAIDHQLPMPSLYHMAGMISQWEQFSHDPLEQLISPLPLKRHIKDGILNRTGQIGDALNAIEEARSYQSSTQNLPSPFANTILSNSKNNTMSVDLIMGALNDRIDQY